MAIEKTQLASGLDVYFARPSGSDSCPAVILFTEGLGLNSDMLEDGIGLLAEAGFLGVAPDFFHGTVFDGTDRDAMIAKIRSIDDTQAMAETRETIDWIRQRSVPKIGGIGFCMGGRLAFLAHATFSEITASACFYGGGIAPDQDGLGRKPLVDRVGEMEGPIFLGYGAEDASITPEEHGRIVAALSKEKKRFEFHLFTNAGHAFLSRSRPNYRPEAATEAWPITFGFLHRNLG